MLRAQVAHAKQSVVATGARLTRCTQVLLRHRRDRFAGLAIRLKASQLANVQAQRDRIARADERTQRLAERARRALITLLQRHEARIAHSGQLLAALSYRGVLARGFALVRDEAGQAVRAASAIGPGAHLTLEFADGQGWALVQGVHWRVHGPPGLRSGDRVRVTGSHESVLDVESA